MFNKDAKFKRSSLERTQLCLGSTNKTPNPSRSHFNHRTPIRTPDESLLRGRCRVETEVVMLSYTHPVSSHLDIPDVHALHSGFHAPRTHCSGRTTWQFVGALNLGSF